MNVPIATCSYPEYRNHMGLATRISLGQPKWWPAGSLDPRAQVWEITPRNSYLRASDAEYERQFFGQLDRYGVSAIEARFREVLAETGAERLVLLCFEVLKTPKVQCHRRDFAGWWERQTGQVVEELGQLPPGPLPPEEEPLVLF